MATSRLRNQTNPRPSHVDSDSGGDTEREHTPRPPPGRTLSKKRLSERLDPDGSFTIDDSNPAPLNSRAPLKTVSINDDVAEKRRRRKSAKLILPLDPDDDPEPGPSGAPHPNDSQDAPTDGSRASNLPRHKTQLLSVPQAPEINVPLDVMTSNFDQWMKMATDNKINAANSWNFALIDYFHDMSLLRNNADNSINFQRASCTLDGCVKIWTSRVDSVGTETGKLLSNLANGGRDEDGADASDNPDGADPSQSQRKRKAYRSESTLVKNPAQLRTKKLDLEFTVDPLFRKTCADFDEGGAQGLLMNHLGLTVALDGSLRVVFDASDSVAKGEEEEQPLEEARAEVDLSYLREQFIPDLSIIDEHEISQSLEQFAFGKDSFSMDDTAFFQDGAHPLDDDDDNDGAGGFGDTSQFSAAMDVDGLSGSAAPVEDFFVGDQAITDDYADFGAGYGGDGDNASIVGSDGTPAEHKQGPFVPFDPRRVPTDREIVMAVSEDGEGVANYFDPTVFKNWAGPEHWKLRKVVRRPDASEAAASRPKREKKEAFRIDFLTPDEEDIRTRKKTLFAPVVRGAGINLPGPSAVKKGRGRKGRNKEKDEKRNDQTLPDDMHFSERQLLTLFLKPKFSLKMRGQRRHPDAEGSGNGSFWAQAGQAADHNDPAADESAMPFDTQFFHDDDDDDGPGFDDVYDGGDSGLPIEAGEQDLLAATQGQTRRVKPETVNYTKRAKRVDVRRLKDNIWKGLDIVAPHVEEGEDAMDTDERPPTDPTEPRSFTSVISGLHKTYPKEKMDEISTSFCFICLLHLANERGLKLEVDGTVETNEEEILATGDNKVGNLWDLKASTVLYFV
ncbi:hypothetical protein GSI_12974 [Ganoderma sinense ZZ0214-1]|uniref:Condensin complex subunit 2 n=1 Tax=Ganoderma sinense ZZ0214-1 TaxID=1077348 RepID=A0A2G8RU98_9APHY|nr:hypothetical protein GSI_12974 [Ganoderma sinense ZZ0214-1]